jgi:drug/metabolite transporter (DMT)-like permease
MLLSLIVLCRVIANPLSNVFQKILTRRSSGALFVIVATHFLMSLACLPIAALVMRHAPLSRAFWFNIGVVAVLTIASNALLVAAVRLSDLSVLGPVNAYKSIISLIPAAILLHERPGLMGLAGMGLIVTGSYFIVDKKVADPGRNVFVRFFTERGVQLRFAAMTLSAIEAVFLKNALLVSSVAPTFVFWAILGFIAGLFAMMLPGTKLQNEIRRVGQSIPVYLSLAVTTGVMQLCTIIVLGDFKVGYALALFQTSTLVSVLLGYRIFNESNFAERLLGSVIMMGGAILIVLKR